MDPVEQRQHAPGGGGNDMLLCCLCSRLLLEPVQLQCLHNCCRPCLDRAAIERSSKVVTCPVCQQATEVNAVKRNFFLEAQTRRYQTLNESKSCSVCREHGSGDRAAIAWCESCRKSLCTDCEPAHSRMNRAHATVSVDDMPSGCLLVAESANPPLCSRHEKPAEFVCLTCKATECTDCWLCCLRDGHEAQHRCHPSVQGHVRLLQDEIARLSDALLSKSAAVCGRVQLRKRLRAARERHLKELKQRKRDVIAAVDVAYVAAETAVKESYDVLDEKADLFERQRARIQQKVSHTVNYSRSMLSTDVAYELLNQHEQLTGQMESILIELAAYEDHPIASSFVVIDHDLPENLDEVLAIWIGIPKLDTGSAFGNAEESVPVALSTTPGEPSVVPFEPQSTSESAAPATPETVLFGSALSTFHAPVSCCDVAVLPDGRLLLAAALNGLKEYSETGQELSCWKPRPTDGRAEDAVSTVEALHDGRAAVGLHYARMVVLLKRIESAGDGDVGYWTEDRRFATLRSPPRHLAAHRDVVTVTEYRSGGLLLPGSTLTLVSLSSGLVSRQRREYDIESVAVTAASLITASSRAVKIEGSSAAHRGAGAAAVVDAYTHRGDRRLWRYETGNCEELVRDICWAASASVLYFAVWSWSDGGGSGSCPAGGVYRVAAVCAENGRELQSGGGLSSERHCLLQPDKLSAAPVGQHTHLAVLSRGMVMVYSGSTSGSDGCSRTSTVDA